MAVEIERSPEYRSVRDPYAPALETRNYFQLLFDDEIRADLEQDAKRGTIALVDDTIYVFDETWVKMRMEFDPLRIIPDNEVSNLRDNVARSINPDEGDLENII